MTEVAAAWGDFSAGQPMVDGWIAQSILGRGGMSIVLEVSKEPLPARAMKVLKPLGRDLGARFMQECAVTANLEHPNIVKVENFGVLSDGSPYLLMERLHGCTLRSVLKEARRRQDAAGRRPLGGAGLRPPHPYLTAEALLQIVRQIGLGLGCAHTASPVVVHRDIKPENVFLHTPRHTRAIEVRLLDFGIATILDDDRLAKEADVAGSPPYMPPEVATGQAVTTAADVYSLAVLIYELLTLHSPWRVPIRSPADVMRVHTQERPLPASHWKGWIPEAVDDVLVRSLVTDPARRPRLGELLERLGELLLVDDGSAKHRHDPDAVVTTDPGLEGLVLATGGRALHESPQPLPVVAPLVPIDERLGAGSSAVGRSATAPSLQQASSVEEVVIGTLDQRPVTSGAKRVGVWLRPVALGGAIVAAAILALAFGGSRVWWAKPLAHAGTSSLEPAATPEVARPALAPSWLDDSSIQGSPRSEPALAPATTDVTGQGVAPANVRPVVRKVSAPASSRPAVMSLDEVLAHPPVTPPVKPSIDDVLIHDVPSASNSASTFR